MHIYHSRAKWFHFVFMVLALGMMVSTAQAVKWKRVTEKTPLKLGQRVQVNWHGDWVDGKIVDIDERFGRDRIRVRFRRPESKSFSSKIPKHFHEMTWSFERSELRVRAKSSKTTKGNPFEPEKGFRKWKDSTGKFEIEAELVKATSDSVQLKRRDGSMVTVPLERLSKEDRKLVNRLQGKEDEEDEDDEDVDESEDDDGTIEFVDQLPLREANMDNVMSVYFAMDSDPSGIKADSGTVTENMAKRTVLLPPQDDFFERTQGLYVAAEAPHRIMVPFWNAHERDRPTRIVLCDLSPGKHRPQSISFPVNVTAADFGPLGKQVLSRSKGFGFGKRARIDLWNIEGEKLVHQFGWKPYKGTGRMAHGRDVRWAAFVDADHVLTLGENDRLVLWKLPDLEAVYTMAVATGSRPALSPGHKYVAVLTGAGLGVLDAKTGEVLGNYTGAEKRGKLIFRPDGKQVAALFEKRLIVWNLHDPKPYRDIALNVNVTNTNSLAWPSENYVLVGGRYLVDLDKYLVMWDYQNVHCAQGIGRQFWCMCSQGDSTAIVPQSLPHNSVLNKVRELNADDIRGIEPGMTVSLEVNVAASANRQAQIRELFQNQLESRGIKVASGQPNKLVVRTRPGEMKRLKYFKILKDPLGFPRRYIIVDDGSDKIVHTINFQSQISEVAFFIDGKVAWEMSTVVREPPSDIDLKEGESIEQAVRRYQKPNCDFFQYVHIPSYVARPRENLSFGASKLTPQGLQPATIQSTKPEKRKRTVDRRV